MPTRKNKGNLLSSDGLGRSIRNAKTQNASAKSCSAKTFGLRQHAELFSVSAKKKGDLHSIVEERTQLDAYLATTLAAQREFNALRGTLHLPSAQPIPATSTNTSTSIASVPIPRRPKFFCSTLVESFDAPLKAHDPSNHFVVDKNSTSENEDNLVQLRDRIFENNFSLHDLHEISAHLNEQIPVSAIKSESCISQPIDDKHTLSKDEMEALEYESFLKWRRELANLEEHQGYVVTPYERNIEIWRQLWRVVERSDIILQILDGRNPLLFRSVDLEKYITEVNASKQSVIVINKADLLTQSQRKQWLEFFKTLNKEVIFFSAIRELYLQGAIQVKECSEISQGLEESRVAFGGITLGYGNVYPEATNDSSGTILTCEALIRFLQQKRGACRLSNSNSAQHSPSWFTVGVVGYPNVGKSSMINSLFGAKKVSVSRQPGRTKHFQTLLMPEYGIILCDCPGLVFPSIVQTKHHLLVNGIISIHYFRGNYLPAIQLICNWIPEQLCMHYKVFSDQLINLKMGEKFCLSASTFLSQLAKNRHFFSAGRGGLLDLFRAAAMVIQDFCCGKLLYCMPPPPGKTTTASLLEDRIAKNLHISPKLVKEDSADEIVTKTSPPSITQLKEDAEDNIRIAEFLHPTRSSLQDHAKT